MFNEFKYKHNFLSIKEDNGNTQSAVGESSLD